jgi:hypothetical protein
VNHQRHLIREAVVALLAAGGTSAGTRVYDHPTDSRTTFPALSVVDVGEDQQGLTLPAGVDRTIEREYLFEVAAEVQRTGAFARERDQLLADVEALLAPAGAVAGVKHIAPAGYVQQTDASGDRPISVGRQRFRALYFTPQGNPATTL